MKEFNCKEVAAVVGGKLIGENTLFNGISIDSRDVIPENMFVAICGSKFDGHDFIEGVVSKGASCVLVSKNISNKLKELQLSIPFILVDNTIIALGKLAKWHRSKFNANTVAITGSMGKTTTRIMLANILAEAGKTLNPEKNFNTDITVPLVLLNLNETYKFAVLEMGACKPKDISYLMDLIKPDLSLITNIGPSHLSSFGDLNTTANTKGEAYSDLKTDGIAVVNVDDAYAPFLLSKLSSQKIITYSIHSKSDVTATEIKINPNNIEFNLVTDSDTIDISLPVLGVHNVLNAVAAAACAIGFGVNLTCIKQGLEKFAGVDRRLQVFAGLNGSKIIDDSYNANPVSVKSALMSLKNDSNPNKVFVFADMGELGADEIEFHKDIGRFAKDCGINSFFATGELAEHASNSFDNDNKFYAKKSDLVLDLKKVLNKNTTVLVKGSNSQRMDEIVKQLLAS